MVEQKEFTAPAEHRVLWKTFKVSLRETGHSTDPTPEDPGLSSQPPHSSPKIHFMLHTQVRIKQRQPSSEEPRLLHPTDQKARRSRQNRFLKQQQARSRGHNPRQGGRT